MEHDWRKAGAFPEQSRRKAGAFPEHSWRIIKQGLKGFRMILRGKLVLEAGSRVFKPKLDRS